MDEGLESAVGHAFVIKGIRVAQFFDARVGHDLNIHLVAVLAGFKVFIGALCFILFLTEGSLLDWSAVFLTSVRGMDASHGGLGYAAFAPTLTIGRLTGDRVVPRVGPIRIVIFGGLCPAGGVALATLVPSWQVALLGYALVGVGCSNIVPVLFSSVGRQTIMPENVAIPAITARNY